MRQQSRWYTGRGQSRRRCVGSLLGLTSSGRFDPYRTWFVAKELNMSGSDPIIKQAVDWLENGKSVALATVVATWGSSPRPAGSQLVVSGDGSFQGSVSGGCIEGAVIQEALEVIVTGVPRTLDFGVSDEQAWAVGLACGGRVKVHVRRVADRVSLVQLLARLPVAWVTALADGRSCLVYPDGAEGPLALDDQTLAAVRQALVDDRSLLLETESGAVFARIINPCLRMIIVGAVHIAQSLVPLAAAMGFEVTVVDPRRAFATEERLPQVAVCDGWPDDEITRLAPDARTAIVALTHDPKLDEPALSAALQSPAYYIGALGSRRTQAKRLERLRQKGFADEELRRIRGPVGIDIGAQSPAEIALSILAEAVAAKYGKAPMQ